MSEKKQKKPICIIGPSCSGKTNLAIQIAKKIDAEIINVDSVTVYKSLNIGSAKPTHQETQGVKHHLLDICEVENEYNVGNFLHDSHKILNSSNKQLIFVGGTMMYFNALLHGFNVSNTNTSYIKTNKTPHQMHEELKSIDNMAFNRLHPNDSQRIIRAWQLAKQGETLSHQWENNDLVYKPLKSLVVSLAPEKRQELDKKLLVRINQMFEDGFIKEVRDLFEKNPKLINNIPKSLNSVGYKQIVEFIKEDSKICKKIDTLKEKVYFAHRSLVKRQTTWLKKFEFGLKLNCMHDCNKNINTLLNKVT